jgi:DNA topoisomerase IB
MARRGGWRRVGSRRHFRYLDSHGDRIADEARIERIEALRIPPAWKDVWISPNPRAKLQATGVDAAGRRQYLYHPEFRAAQEQAKYDKLVRFAERLPDIRAAMAEHMDRDELDQDRVCAVAIRLVNLGWFRVGSDRHTRRSRTFGLTTLTGRHVRVRGERLTFRFRAKHRSMVRRTIVDAELADAVKALLAADGARVFRFERDGELVNLTGAHLNEYIGRHMGDEFTVKDFRTWGGTLTAAVALAERGVAESDADARRELAAVMRQVGEQLGNTPAVARASYVSPAVIEQYLDGRTVEDFRARHLRVVKARDIELDPEEQAVLSRLRSWRIRRARDAA